MQVFRRGDRGPAVQIFRGKLERPVVTELEAAALAARTATRRRAGEPSSTTSPITRSAASSRSAACASTAWSDPRPTAPSTRRTGGSATGCCPTRVSRPFIGDDVAALQQRLLEMGFDPGRCDGIFGARHRRRRSRSSSATSGCAPTARWALARCARSSSSAGPSPAGRRRNGVRRNDCGRGVGASPAASSCSIPATADRPRAPRTRPGRGRDRARPRDADRRPARRARRDDVPDPQRRDLSPTTGRGRRSPTSGRRDLRLAAPRRGHQPPRRAAVACYFYGAEPAGPRGAVRRRGAARRPDQPGDRDPHRPGGRPHATRSPGSCSG